MSLIDIAQLSPLALVSQYLSETAGKASFLTRDEISIIERWIVLAKGRTEEIILVLEAEYSRRRNAQATSARRPPSLKALDKLISSKFRESSFLAD